MAEQRRIGYKWNLRTVMAQRNLWKSTELMPLLKSRGINLSESQVYRLVVRRAAKTAHAPTRLEDLGVKPGSPIARRVRIVQDDEDG
jgi:hypothetical protein